MNHLEAYGQSSHLLTQSPKSGVKKPPIHEGLGAFLHCLRKGLEGVAQEAGEGGDKRWVAQEFKK